MCWLYHRDFGFVINVIHMDAVEMKGRKWILQTFQYEEKIYFPAFYSNQEHRERREIIIGFF